MFPVSVPVIFKISWRASVLKSPFNKVTRDISAFCNSFKNSSTCIGMFRKVVLLRVSRSPLLTGVAGLLQSRVCNATENEQLAKFLKGALELTENIQEVTSSGVLFSKL